MSDIRRVTVLIDCREDCPDHVVEINTKALLEECMDVLEVTCEPE